MWWWWHIDLINYQLISMWLLLSGSRGNQLPSCLLWRITERIWLYNKITLFPPLLLTDKNNNVNHLSLKHMIFFRCCRYVVFLFCCNFLLSGHILSSEGSVSFYSTVVLCFLKIETTACTKTLPAFFCYIFELFIVAKVIHTGLIQQNGWIWGKEKLEWEIFTWDKQKGQQIF